MKPTEKYNQIKKILEDLDSQNKDFIKLNTKISEILKEINTNKNRLKSRKIKLLNLLLNHSKKKILFKFTQEKDIKSVYSQDKSYTIGLNENGLGIYKHKWEHNLKNITEYYIEDEFNNLLKNKDFVKEFLKIVNKHLKGKHKTIMKLLVEKELEEENITFDIEDLRVVLGDYIQYKICEDKESERYSNISLVSAEDNGNFYFSELKNYCKLLENKKEIKFGLKREIKDFIKKGKVVNRKLKQVDKELSPYEALAEI